MGSRAVVLVCRDRRRRGPGSAPAGAVGAVHTRTGRSFFARTLTAELAATGCARRRGGRAVRRAGHRLAAARRRAAAVVGQGRGPAPRPVRRRRGGRAGALPAALAALEPAAAAGLDVGELLATAPRRRAANADAFTEAYRRYCWPTDGLDGVRLAPFQVLATEGATYHDRPHALAPRRSPTGWCAADPELIAPTRRVLVDTDRPGSTAAATAWWEELTAAGGEGMVVKPAGQPDPRTAKGLVQPGMKVPRAGVPADHLRPGLHRAGEPGPAARPRDLGHKRSLALREYALGPGGAGPGRRAASRCGGSTSASSPSWRWSPSRSTRGCDQVSDHHGEIHRIDTVSDFECRRPRSSGLPAMATTGRGWVTAVPATDQDVLAATTIH